MAWCRQATSHYLSQCWPRSLSPYGVTRPQWVKNTSALSVSTVVADGLAQLGAGTSAGKVVTKCVSYIYGLVQERHNASALAFHSQTDVKRDKVLYLLRLIISVYRSVHWYNKLPCSWIATADSRFAPSQWETALLCNDVSHGLGANLESTLDYCWSLPGLLSLKHFNPCQVTAI